MKLFVTYGFGSNLANCYSVVEGDGILNCYQQVKDKCGMAYAFVYNEAEFEGQPEKYGLGEVPLQAQVKNTGT
jgi:hypothetical protein